MTTTMLLHYSKQQKTTSITAQYHFNTSLQTCIDNVSMTRRDMPEASKGSSGMLRFSAKFFPQINTTVSSDAVSKGMRPVKLCTNKILQFLTGGAG